MIGFNRLCDNYPISLVVDNSRDLSVVGQESYLVGFGEQSSLVGCWRTVGFSRLLVNSRVKSVVEE